MISALMPVHIVSLLTVLMDIAQYQTAVNGCKKKKKKKKEKRNQETTLVLLERRHANIICENEVTHNSTTAFPRASFQK